jgi:hypothetical protein
MAGIKLAISVTPCPMEWRQSTRSSAGYDQIGILWILRQAARLASPLHSIRSAGDLRRIALA